MADDELNEPQARAVAHTSGPLLVFAGAGSGKTRVITYRIANLVACAQVPPYRILAVTFTNKAAAEMRSRLDKILPDGMARDLWVGTFHATCAKLLRRHADAVGLSSSFVIYDSSDQKSLVNRVLKELDIDDRRFPPRAMLARIHKEKQEARGPEEMSLDSYVDETAKKVYVRYEEALRAANAVDFEDLILHVVRIAEAKDDAPAAVLESRDALRRKFEHVLVDEFQDTNATQYRLLRAFAGRTRNLCVVGDDDQSIYRWRGADVRNIRGFRRDYPETTVVKLEQNYRSSQRIVSAALAVIKPSPTREPKELWTDNPPGAKVAVIAAGDERDEAALVVRLVMDARGQGIPADDIAVFYRVHAQSRVLEEALRSANLPYQIIGGMKFYERAEVKDAISYLRLLVNPKSDVDFLRIVNTPARGIGATSVERLVAFATTEKLAITDALRRLDEVPDLASAAKKRLAALRDLLVDLGRDAETATPGDVLSEVLSRTGYRSALQNEDTAEADARLENLAELEGSMHDYADEASARGEAPTLSGFLERVSLQADTDKLGAEERVTLMTVHGAKGLEFDVVLLTGMEEDMFPYRSQDGQTPEELEEERRLGYVAVTRARKHLVLTHTRTRQIFGTTRVGRPSRFILDMPPDVVDHHATPAAQSIASQRFIDRENVQSTRSWKPGAAARTWQHPQAAASSRAPDPGERYVERDVEPDWDGEGVPIRKGMRVKHARFGEGEVKKVLEAGEPAVLAFFPGWGEVKVLARFLSLA